MMHALAIGKIIELLEGEPIGIPLGHINQIAIPPEHRFARVRLAPSAPDRLVEDDLLPVDLHIRTWNKEPLPLTYESVGFTQVALVPRDAEAIHCVPDLLGFEGILRLLHGASVGVLGDGGYEPGTLVMTAQEITS